MTTTIGDGVRDGIARGLAAIGLAGVALIHLLDLPGQLNQTPYMFIHGLGLVGLSARTKFVITTGVLLLAVTVESVARKGRASSGRA